MNTRRMTTTMQKVAREASRVFHVPDSDILCASRTSRTVVKARHALIAALYNAYGYSQNELSAFLGVDHTTVGYALRKARQRANINPDYSAALKRCREYAESLRNQPCELVDPDERDATQIAVGGE